MKDINKINKSLLGMDYNNQHLLLYAEAIQQYIVLDHTEVVALVVVVIIVEVPRLAMLYFRVLLFFLIPVNNYNLVLIKGKTEATFVESHLTSVAFDFQTAAIKSN